MGRAKNDGKIAVVLFVFCFELTFAAVFRGMIHFKSRGILTIDASLPGSEKMKILDQRLKRVKAKM